MKRRCFFWPPMEVQVVVVVLLLVVQDEDDEFDFVLEMTLRRALAYSVSSKAAMRSLCMFISIWPANC